MQRSPLTCSGFLLLTLLAAGIAACAAPRLVPLAPAGDAPREGVAIRTAGLALTALPAPWPGSPADLARSVTPILLHLANEGEAAVFVRFEDFLLLDSGRREYRALSPLEVVTILYGSAASRTEILPAIHRHPFLFHGYLSDPFFYPYDPYHPYYAQAPYAWPPGRDIIRLALREGRVVPGHRVEGFLLFQHAAAGTAPFTLSWAPRNPETGGTIATLSLPLGLSAT